MARTGRPTKYTPKLTAKILTLISEGQSLRRVCRDERLPAASTVFEWLIRYDDFSEQYARAKQQGSEAMAEEIMDIADDGRNDWIEIWDKKGENIIGYKVNGEAVQRSKLRVDTRKWLMSKLAPKKYGDSLDLTSGGEKIKVAPMYGGSSVDDGSTEPPAN